MQLIRIAHLFHEFAIMNVDRWDKEAPEDIAKKTSITALKQSVLLEVFCMEAKTKGKTKRLLYSSF
jgi:hypothetical protein